MTRILPALLVAAVSVAFSQTPAAPTPPARPGAELLAFTLEENRGETAVKLGPPVHTGAFGPGYISWFYQVGMSDEDFSHTLLFRTSDGKLVSITRAFDPEITVDHLFPASETVMRYWPDAKAPQFKARVRKLSGDRLLVAMGSAEGQKCGQVLLIRRSAVPIFFPWLEDPTPGKP